MPEWPCHFGHLVCSCLPFLYQVTLGLGAPHATHLRTFVDPSCTTMVSALWGTVILGGVGAVNRITDYENITYIQYSKCYTSIPIHTGCK